MQSPRPSAALVVDAVDNRHGAYGHRGTITFTPSVGSVETLTAGVVVKLNDGTTHWRSAVDRARVEHAFGAQGAALAAVAERLCQSLADHWSSHPVRQWQPPFDGARLTNVEEFTASSVDSGIDFSLGIDSSLHVLLQAYEMPAKGRATGIVQRVRRVVNSQQGTRHLVKRFDRDLEIGNSAGLLRVDFLGQHYACYFLALTQSARGVDGNTERALAKLYELGSLRRFVDSRRQSLGLLEDERPATFELLTVGSRLTSPERQAWARIETLADRDEVLTRAMNDVSAAAAHVVAMERKAA